VAEQGEFDAVSGGTTNRVMELASVVEWAG